MKKFVFPALLALLCACGNHGTVECADGTIVRLQAVSPQIVRVTAVPGGELRDRSSLAVVPQEPFSDYSVSETDSTYVLKTEALTVKVDKRGSSLWFYGSDGSLLAGGAAMSFSPAEADGRKAWSTRLSYPSPAGEAFYGLGQHQAGELNHKGRNEELYQYNTKISVPIVVSSRGYGILFDAYSFSRWGNPEPYRQLGEVFTIYDADGVEGALTGRYFPSSGKPLVRREDSLYFENEWAIRNLPADVPLNGAKVVYEGWLEAPTSGEYHFIQYYAGFQKTFVGGREVMPERWRAAWNPNSYKFTVQLEAGVRTPVRIEWRPDGDVSYMGLRVAPLFPGQDDFCFSSEFEPSLDCYFIAGGDYDGVLRGYRRLTGKAQVMPKWVLGFWQSRERYPSQEDLVETLAEMRRRHIPVDNIVQDWMYWEPDQWGSHEFDTTRYPNPEKMLDDVHAMNARFMISVWPKFYTNTAHYRELRDAGYTYTNAEDAGITDWLGNRETFYDAYAPGGRQMFWRQMDESLYSRYGRKIDAWWMDASEPNLRDCQPLDYLKWLLMPNALGSSTEYLNTYALVNAQAIYEGQRSLEPDRRVFLLTRNGFAGLQRYSTASWSGDIGTSWTDMRAQMAAGLGYSMSGIPFWGMDIGGFSVMSKFYEESGADEWRELQTRWHQFGAFVPIFRAHGPWPRRELWNIAPEGSPAYESILWYMRLRYRLMPYLYSLAGAVCFEDATLMRGLPMDFPADPEVRDLSDQWLFGPALMPCPVSQYKARSRSVYFPMGGWYDFYTGRYIVGGKRFTVDAPYERMPLYVREGSIIPFGPQIEWCDQKPSDDILLAVYAGADASFTLYEDDGLSYGYERGEYSTIELRWSDAGRTLTVGPRKGSWPGMLRSRRFRVVVADPSRPFAYDPDAAGDAVVEYDGKEQTVTIK